MDQLWAEVAEDIHRDDARLPQGHALTELQPPLVEVTGSTVAITCPVRQGVDLERLEAALMALQPVQDHASKSQSRFSSRRVSVRTTQEGRYLVLTQGDRDIRLRVPYAATEGTPCVTVTKRGGRLEKHDLPLIAHILAMTNNLQLDGLSSRPHLTNGHANADTFGGQINLDSRDLLELHGTLHSLFEEYTKDLFLGDTDNPFEGMGHGVHHHGMAHSGPRQDSNIGIDSPGNSSAAQKSPLKRTVAELQGMGAVVHLPEDGEGNGWEVMAGYEEQKALVEDLVLMAITHAEEYAKVAKRTRRDGTSPRPKAVLFEGPPGTGKTTCARVVAAQAAIPLVYIPLEAIASKWYGESEQKLSSILQKAEDMGGCIIFLDEIDALATKRNDDMNEATRRLLGVLLRFIDGFQATDSIVIAATNRKQDLDAAMLSRCDSIVSFGLPDQRCRASILKHYAAHLPDKELDSLASETSGMSARDLRAICEVAERRWVAATIRGKEKKDSLPPLSVYVQSAQGRIAAMRETPGNSKELHAMDKLFAPVRPYVGKQL